MGYLLTKKAEATIEKTSLGIPYVKPDRETTGNILAGLTAGGGLAASGMFGDGLFKDKLLADANFRHAVRDDSMKLKKKILEMAGGDEGWLAKRLYKTVPGEVDRVPTLLNRIIARGSAYSAGFKHLKWPGKLKALGLLAAPIAAGGLVDAAIN